MVAGMDSDEERCSRRSKMLLPVTGVLTKEGIPFYHLRRYALKSIHLQRIKQCGWFSFYLQSFFLLAQRLEKI